jgi:hypothetical protein
MYVNTASQRPPRGAALRAGEKAATAHAAAVEIRGLKAPFEQGDFVPPHPPRLIGKCNCRRGELVVDAEHGCEIPGQPPSLLVSRKPVAECHGKTHRRSWTQATAWDRSSIGPFHYCTPNALNTASFGSA